MYYGKISAYSPHEVTIFKSPSLLLKTSSYPTKLVISLLFLMAKSIK